MSEVYSDALVITLIANAALIVISFFFVGLTRGLEWMARRSVREVKVATSAEAERKKRALIAMSAVTRYLEAEGFKESRIDTGAKPKSTNQEEKE